MAYLSGSFLLFTAVLLLVYNIFPYRFRPYVLLVGSLVFVGSHGIAGLTLVSLTSLLAFFLGFLINKSSKGKKALFILSEILILLPWLGFKLSGYTGAFPFITVVGISFYSLVLYSYLYDVYTGAVLPETNPFIFLSTVMFFPNIVQGPIMKYNVLRDGIKNSERPDLNAFGEALLKILFGVFLKLVIADKAALLVNRVYASYESLTGLCIITAAVLYSAELYTDFSACVYISKGVAEMFGIHILMNFKRPYFSASFKEFWRRWHISLGSYLADYVYIPLGGNRKGKTRKCLNLLVVFLISGIWHGTGFNFILWGILHGIYRVFEEITGLDKKIPKKGIGMSTYGLCFRPLRAIHAHELGPSRANGEVRDVVHCIGMSTYGLCFRPLRAIHAHVLGPSRANGEVRDVVHCIGLFSKRLSVLIFTVFGWMIFRASSLTEALRLCIFMFKGIPESFKSLLSLIKELYGMKEFLILLFAMLILFIK